MLLIRLLLVPALVVLITLAGRRWGPAVAGWLTGFPVVAGPILLVVSLEQGPDFAAGAALWALTGVMANVSFGVAYSCAATRLPWWLCLPAATVAFCAAALALTSYPFSPLAALGLTVIGLWLAPRAFPHVQIELPAKAPPRGELAARMLAGTGMVLAVTYFANSLGPHLSGVATAYPVMSLVLAVFSHGVAGPGFAIHLLRGVAGGLYAFAAFCFAVSVLLPRLGTTYTFPLAMAAALAVQGTTFWIRYRSAAVQRGR